MHKTILTQFHAGRRLAVGAKVCSLKTFAGRRGLENAFGFKAREGQSRDAQLLWHRAVGLAGGFELERSLQHHPRIDQLIRAPATRRRNRFSVAILTTLRCGRLNSLVVFLKHWISQDSDALCWPRTVRRLAPQHRER